MIDSRWLIFNREVEVSVRVQRYDMIGMPSCDVRMMDG